MRYGSEIYEVKFVDGCFLAVGEDTFTGDDFMTFEVIGNIHENPELLEDDDAGRT